MTQNWWKNNKKINCRDFSHFKSWTCLFTDSNIDKNQLHDHLINEQNSLLRPILNYWTTKAQSIIKVITPRRVPLERVYVCHACCLYFTLCAHTTMLPIRIWRFTMTSTMRRIRRALCIYLCMIEYLYHFRCVYTLARTNTDKINCFFGIRFFNPDSIRSTSKIKCSQFKFNFNVNSQSF